jgi:membrane protein implicated in regulation of membrane protease activity
MFWLRLPLLFFVFSTSVLVLSCLYCSGLLLFYCGYVPLVPLFWLRLPLLFFVFSTSVLVLSFSCGGRFHHNHNRNTAGRYNINKEETNGRRLVRARDFKNKN